MLLVEAVEQKILRKRERAFAFLLPCGTNFLNYFLVARARAALIKLLIIHQYNNSAK
jgi:hypothetical protein